MLVALRVELPQPDEPGAQVAGQAVDAVVVDLDEVARGIAQVELDDVAGQLDEPVAEGPVVERAAALGGAVDRLDVVDRDAEVVVARRLQVLLEEVAGRVAQVELDDVAGQLDQAVAEGLVVERAPPLGGAVDGLDVVDGDADEPSPLRRQVALEEMQLRAPEGQPLDGDAEVRRGDRLSAEQLDIELGGALEIERVDADMVDAQTHRAPFVVV